MVALDVAVDEAHLTITQHNGTQQRRTATADGTSAGVSDTEAHGQLHALYTHGTMINYTSSLMLSPVLPAPNRSTNP